VNENDVHTYAKYLYTRSKSTGGVMMSLRTYVLHGLALMVLISTMAIINDPGEVRALPEGYPVSLSGGYSEEVQGTTTYVARVQRHMSIIFNLMIPRTI
jgi:hypothetical protein